MRWIALIAVVAAIAGHAASQNIVDNVVAQVGSFFQSAEEAPYTIIKRTNNYVERSYPARKWVCTEQDAPVNEDVTGTQFWKLFRYIQGNNDQSQKMEMTVPVSNQYTPASTGDLATYRMCFYIGQEYQANTAQPSDTAVFIEERPAMNIFTRTVGGYMEDDDNSRWMAETTTVRGFLDSMEESFATNSVWRVGYDAPWKFWLRRNEVWFKKN